MHSHHERSQDSDRAIRPVPVIEIAEAFVTMQIVGGRLLLVDGDVELCNSLRKTLAADGFAVESAH